MVRFFSITLYTDIDLDKNDLEELIADGTVAKSHERFQNLKLHFSEQQEQETNRH